MKNLLIILFVFINVLQAFPQACTPNPQYLGNPGVYPDSLTGIADAYVGVSYSDVITFVNPDDTTINLPGVGIVTLILNYYKIDSVKIITTDTFDISTIGFSYACNPSNCQMPGNGSGCLTIQCSNPAAQYVGEYPVIIYSTPNFTHPLLGTFNAPQIQSRNDDYLISLTNNIPSASFTPVFPSICVGQPLAFTNTSTNSLSYSWSFPNGSPVSSNDINPTVTYSTAGNYTATLVATYGINTDTYSTSITVVNPANPASISYNGNTTFCQGQSLLLNASAGATFQWKNNGVDISGATSNSYSAISSGSYTVVVTENTGCITTSSPVVITVNTLPSVSITGLSSTYCHNAAPVTLVGSPSGGIFTVSGNVTSTLTPSAYNLGPVLVQYIYSDGNSCTNTASQIITILAAPQPVISGLNTNYLLSDNSVTITGTPSGGVFYGTGVSENMFSPSIAGLGTHSVIYYVQSGNCANATGLCTTVDLQIGIGGEDMNGNGGNLSVMPNPNSGSFTINLNAINPLGFTTIEIFNSIGQLIQTETINNQTNTLRKQVELNVAKGIYTIRVTTNGNVFSEKLIIK